MHNYLQGRKLLSVSRLTILIVLFSVFACIHSGAENLVDIRPLTFSADTIFTRGMPLTLDIYIENDVTIKGMNIGLRIWSPDGAGWQWLDVGGYGPAGIVTVAPESRLDPPESVFEITGLAVNEHDIDETGSDTILVTGVSMANGLPPGSLEHMYSYHFTATGDGGDDSWVGTLCFDSCFVPPASEFMFHDGNSGFTPIIVWPSGGACYPVRSPVPCLAFWDPGNPVAMHIDHCGSGTVTLAAGHILEDQIAFELGSVSGGNGTATLIDYGDGTVDITYTPHPGDVGQPINISVIVNCASYPPGWGIYTDVSVTVAGEPPKIEAGLWHNAAGYNNAFVKTDIAGFDPDQCDEPEYGVVSGPGNIDPVTGIYTWTPTIDDVGGRFIYVSAFDGSVAAVDSFYLGVVDAESIPGNANCNDDVDISDCVFLINYIFRGGAAPPIINWADANADCAVNVGDVIFLIKYILKMGPEPQLGCVN